MHIDDRTLTKDGISAQNDGRILILGCGALAREILAIIDKNGLSHVDLHCLPAILHNTPEKITDAVEKAVLEHSKCYKTVFVAYADCGTGGLLKAKCDSLGVEMLQGPHCYSFFEGNDVFAGRDEMTAFYLTDFLVRQFDAFVTQPLGLDRHPELRDMYFGNYTKLVYQSQVHDPALLEKAQACAEMLGLPLEHRHTGYGDLEVELRGL